MDGDAGLWNQVSDCSDIKLSLIQRIEWPHPVLQVSMLSNTVLVRNHCSSLWSIEICVGWLYFYRTKQIECGVNVVDAPFKQSNSCIWQQELSLYIGCN